MFFTRPEAPISTMKRMPPTSWLCGRKSNEKLSHAFFGRVIAQIRALLPRRTRAANFSVAVHGKFRRLEPSKLD